MKDENREQGSVPFCSIEHGIGEKASSHDFCLSFLPTENLIMILKKGRHGEKEGSYKSKNTYHTLQCCYLKIVT